VHLRALAAKPAFPGENLASLSEAVERAEERLRWLERGSAEERPHELGCEAVFTSTA